MDRRLTESIWCTGKDSNLRTSLGGTDLQSVGFNHSPTCAKLPGTHSVSQSGNTSTELRTKTSFARNHHNRKYSYGVPLDEVLYRAAPRKCVIYTGAGEGI